MSAPTSAPSQIKCPHCGQLTSTASGFCDNCGLELNAAPVPAMATAGKSASPATLPAQMICPHCGQLTNTASGFCDNCGLDLHDTASAATTGAPRSATATTGATSTLTCPFCGYTLRPGARHCPNCGKKLPIPAEETANPAATVQMAVGDPSGPPSALKIGAIVADRYGLEKILGEGGMGRVWKAFDRHLNKYVVIKTVLTPDPDLLVALRKEAEVLINIRHPNIVSVFDFFTVENELCYVMEFISGPSWEDEINDPTTKELTKPMSAEEALNRVRGVLPAFKYLEGLKPPIIYCDFKPANVKSMVLPNGEVVQVLLDFGTAYLYDPKVPPKPARGTPGYHSPNAFHPDWRDDFFTIGRTIAELVGMAEVHQQQYKYTLTPSDQYPWTQYDESFRYLVEWLTAYNRDERPQNIDLILEEIDGVIGYVKGQTAQLRTAAPRATAPHFSQQTVHLDATTGSISGTGTVKIELPQVSANNPASTVLISAQEAYEQRNMTRALLLTNQAINNGGGAQAYVLRSLIHNQIGDATNAQADLDQASKMSDTTVQWQVALAEGQLAENAGHLDVAVDRYQKMMSLRPGDFRGRLLLADLYRRSGNYQQAIPQYQAIIQAKPSVGQAYIGASKAFLAEKQLDQAIKMLETVSSRNTSYNEVLFELIQMYNEKAMEGNVTSLDQAARAISVLRENGVESRQLYKIIGEFYYTALQIARKTKQVPAVNWPSGESIKTIGQLSQRNEAAWRDYLARDDDSDRNTVIADRILAGRTWSLM